jgi:multicomponent Na+:H+ antiporter subunit F
MIVIILVILTAALVTFYRVMKGPTPFDRIAAADSIGIMFLLVLVLLAVYFEREIFVDVAIVYALLLFVDVLIMARYFGR